MTDDRIGETIDRRYRIERRLGSGGMGVVYAAEHVGLGRQVAIKLLRSEHVEPTLRERFRREAKHASRIVHPNIVEVLDVGSDGGVDYIAMELVAGRDLGAVVSEGRLAIDRAVALTRQMLDALQAVHAAGIIHRDIKPSNVLLAPGDVVKLMDFGIARGLEDATLTRTGNVVGTTEFMAPEQLRGAAVDHRADLYAVGITLFAMLAGDVPFRGATAVVAGAQVFAPPPSLARLRPEIPAHVVAAVERALAKAPGDRFPDARAFAAALLAPTEPPLEVLTVVARPAGRERPSSRRWWLVAVAALVGIAAALTIRQLSHHTAPVVASAPADAVTARDAPAATPPSDTVIAAVPVDAGVALDAAVAKPPPRGGSAIAATGRPLHCFCTPTDAADQLPLCETRGPSLCRCDGKIESLCEKPVNLRCVPERVSADEPCRARFGDCPYNHNAFNQQGTLDAPCTGYPTAYLRLTKGVGGAQPELGHVDCDVCVGIALDTYVGHPGDACTGFFWRSGVVRHGKLDFCR